MQVIAMPAFKNRQQNPYNWLLYSSIKQLGINVDEFATHRLLDRKYNIWHMHWPEVPLNHKNQFKALMKIKSLFLQMDWAKSQGIKLVWTAHNLANHERLYPELEAWFWQSLTQRLDGYISLSHAGLEATQKYFPELNNIPGFVIPHNHYRGEYPDEVTREEARRKLGISPHAKMLLFFGRIRTYKNVPQLLTAFRKFSDPDALLYIAGSAEMPALAELCAREVILNSRLRTKLDFVAQNVTQLYFRAADLVILPYNEILNSGTALLSLSFNRPVLVPLRGAMAELQAEVGQEWVRTYEGEISPDDIKTALAWALNTPRSQQAPLEDFDIKKLAQQTIDVYQKIAS